MKILFVYPGCLDLPTGGYRYDREIINQWRQSGHEVKLLQLEGGYPFPTDLERKAAIASLAELAKFDVAVVDGLAGGALPEFMKLLSQQGKLVALVHHPLTLESGLSENQAEALYASEELGLRHVDAIITTSPTTSNTVAEMYAVSPNKIQCIVPGLEPFDLEILSDSEEVRLLCVGSFVERKGQLHLVEALSDLTDLAWHLDCAGATELNEEYTNRVMNLIEECGLSERIAIHGAVTEEELKKLYSRAEVFVLPSLYEGYGMAYAEAISAGLPVIGTKAGAVPQTVPQGCGILVEPANVSQLRIALRTMIADDDARNAYKNTAYEAKSSFPTWKESADKFADILKQVSVHRSFQ